MDTRFSYTDIPSSEQDKLKRMRRYSQYFEGCSNVLDIGCGRGEFLQALSERGISGSGVDMDPVCIARCEEKGLEAHEADALAHLSDRHREYGGIMCSHVIEHFAPMDAQRFLSACFQALRDEGVIVILTPNPKSMRVMADMFWEDPTHVRPYPAKLLEIMLAKEGFSVQEQGDDRRPRLRGIRGWLKKCVIGDWLPGNDLYVVARKSSH